MATIVVLVEGLSLMLLYRNAISERTAQLVELAESQARLMESVARYDARDAQYHNNEEVPGGEEATLSQIRDAHKYDKGFGKTGEVVLGKLREDNQIEFLLSHRLGVLAPRNTIPFESNLAEPMRMALTSKSGGTLIGLDYRGVKVMAAYEPVAVLNYGLVTKIDITEIKDPFINTVLISSGVTVILILGGTMLFLRIGNPVVQRSEESEEKYQILFDSSANGILLATDRFVDCNKEACRLFGFDRNEIIGRRPGGLSPAIQPNGQKSTKAAKAHILAALQGQQQRFYWCCRRKDDSLFDSHISLKVVEVEGRKMIMALIRDITQDRKKEAATRHHQKLESIGTLAGGVAHEINNPVNGIINYAQLISDNLENGSSLQEYTKAIIQESDRISTIVRNLLSFSRNEKETHSLARMADIVNSTISLIQTIIRHDQITLQVQVADNLPNIKCRSQQIQQVLMNLLTNGRDALNERYPGFNENKILLVTVESLEKEGEKWIRTTVEDHGSGITGEIGDRLFDPFFTSKDKTKGTGLGLSISYGIVQEHDGLLYFETVPEQFTRFNLELPVDNGW